MTEKINVLTSDDLAKIFGGTQIFHKHMLQVAIKYGLSEQYLAYHANGELVLAESGLDEYKKLLLRTVSMTFNNPLRDLFYSAYDLSAIFGKWATKFYVNTLSELYNKIESGVQCGLSKGDIIISYCRGASFRKNYTYLLKKDSLQKYAEIIQRALNNEYEWLTQLYFEKLGFSRYKTSQALDWAYKQIQSGNDIGLSPDDIKISSTRRKSSTSRVAYRIKSTAMDTFIKVTGLTANPNQTGKPYKKYGPTKSTNQDVHDAWGYEWVTTYSQLPHGKER